MQATLSRTKPRAHAQRSSFKGIGRSLKYLTNHKRQALLPYVFLIIATLSQLAVPRMVRNVIDAVTSGYVADQILKGIDQMPANLVGAGLPGILEATGRSASLTLEQLKTQLQADVTNAPQARPVQHSDTARGLRGSRPSKSCLCTPSSGTARRF